VKARSQPSAALHALAFCAFSIAALWTARATLEEPAAVVKLRLPANAIWTSDVRRNLAQIAYVSRTLTTDPRRFFDGPMCYPTPSSVSLGEHMLGEGLLGLPAHLLWDDPVVTFNFVVAVRPLLGALSMYALAYFWTRNAGSALIAGFLFGFHPLRLQDLTHPSVVGNEWIPAILLAMHLLFARRLWRDAVALAVLTGLQMLESLYVLLQLAIAASVYGSYLLWRYRRSVPALLPKLTLLAVPLAALGAWSLGPYLETREMWGVLQGRRAFPAPIGFLHFGDHFYPGSCLLLLAALGFLDRLRGARTSCGYDPRLPLVLLALAATWFVIPWRLPATDLVISSLRQLLVPWVPGLDAVRAPANVVFVAVVPLALLAAYGVLALTEKLAPSRRRTIAACLAIACATEVFHPALATRSFGAPMPSTVFRVRPDEKDLAVLRDLPPGPVLDVPLNYQGLGVLFMSRAVLLGAYHGRRQAACKASFITPVQHEIAAIVERLPSSIAAQELWALGLRTIVFYGQKDRRSRAAADAIIKVLTHPAAKPRLVPVGVGSTVRVFEMTAGAPATSDVALLTPVVAAQTSRTAAEIELRFGIRSTASTFRHPDPVRMTDLVVTWRNTGIAAQSKRLRALLPLALAPGRTAQIVVEDRAPPIPGTYEVTLTLGTDPERVLGARRVVVTERAAKPDVRSSRGGGDGGST
jgi:hypothetical protein